MSRLNSTVFWGVLWKRGLAIGQANTAATATAATARIKNAAVFNLGTRDLAGLATVDVPSIEEKSFYDPSMHCSKRTVEAEDYAFTRTSLVTRPDRFQSDT